MAMTRFIFKSITLTVKAHEELVSDAALPGCEYIIEAVTGFAAQAFVKHQSVRDHEQCHLACRRLTEEVTLPTNLYITTIFLYTM